MPSSQFYIQIDQNYQSSTFVSINSSFIHSIIVFNITSPINSTYIYLCEVGISDNYGTYVDNVKLFNMD